MFASTHIRRRSALWIAAWFTLGTVAAPLAHYTWMAVSEAYSSPMHHASGETHGEHVASFAPDHVACNYDEIFATAHSVHVDTVSAASVHDGADILLHPDDAICISEVEGAAHPRGPPSA
ncbi:MAG: hypothetical protein HKN17_08965 [Rhodothermales bacterium]|nr:hypothetical protein [Rhodothermales bacterium]